MKKFRLKKDDLVVVLTGKDKGKQGKILQVLRSEDRVVVAGVAEVKRHKKPTQGDPGGIVTKNRPLHISNVNLVDPKTNKPTRVGYKILSDGRKVRVAKRSGEVIDG